LFWREIAKGLTSEDAAIAVGASQAAGSRWFRERGGMPTFLLAPVTGRYLSFEEREEIAVLKAQDAGVREIARRLGRDPSTISRELRRDARRKAGLPGVGRAVEGGVDDASAEDREACRE
jgi:DNA-binding CsgD family transcriptional regulator